MSQTIPQTQPSSTPQQSSLLETSFPNIPRFPINVPTAPLIRLSLARLRNHDKDESARLFNASKDLGFFYLDLRSDNAGEQILSEADSLFHVGEELFEIGRGELDKYDYSDQGSYFGYKGFGKAFADEEGRLDRNEFYNVSFSNPPIYQTI
jgi:non-haem dioxygenase in morphine synthesis N-terminal